MMMKMSKRWKPRWKMPAKLAQNFGKKRFKRFLCKKE